MLRRWYVEWWRWRWRWAGGGGGVVVAVERNGDVALVVIGGSGGSGIGG